MVWILVSTLCAVLLCTLTIIRKFNIYARSLIIDIRQSLLFIPLEMLLIDARGKVLAKNLEWSLTYTIWS